eukprot:CAMPEP_0185755530 /NCGR_PEP_ID=MMETSP1174-20130828/14008_1 /TAXON_ID=35687 /ORGANISM="Dictyocha speculum, Strain CCMP1381" /LENGTH=370 /DNA_ID=CAMNT_0028434103 /DNA_START=85 /DNA_END=1198 /DNA_ORIENTATION=+
MFHRKVAKAKSTIEGRAQNSFQSSGDENYGDDYSDSWDAPPSRQPSQGWGSDERQPGSRSRGGRGRGGMRGRGGARGRGRDSGRAERSFEGQSTPRAPVKREPSPFDHIYGIQPVLNALLMKQRPRFVELMLQQGSFQNPQREEGALGRIASLAGEISGLQMSLVDKHDLNMLSGNRPHQGVVLLAEPLPLQTLDTLPSPDEGTTPCWLALDEVVDPQNLGALIRSACFLGAEGVITSVKNSAPLSPSVSKASAGAMELVNIHATKNLPRLLENARQDGWRVVGTALSDDSIPLEELKPGRPTIVVLGNEGHGLRTNVRRACDVTVRIARGTRSMKQKEAAELGDLDSLNVSVSGGILLHHLLGNIPMTD